jgi:hypothetical protein
MDARHEAMRDLVRARRRRGATLATALVVRWHTSSLVGVGAFAPAVIAFRTGGVTAAWFAARLPSRVADHGLAVKLMRKLMRKQGFAPNRGGHR